MGVNIVYCIILYYITCIMPLLISDIFFLLVNLYTKQRVYKFEDIIFYHIYSESNILIDNI